MEQMKFCPLMTIARSVAADQVVSHGNCQGEKCAWWDTNLETCSIQAISTELDHVAKAILVASGHEPYEAHFS